MRISQEKTLHLLQRGEITLQKAVKISQMNVWDFTDLIKERKIIWIKDKTIREDIREALSGR